MHLSAIEALIDQGDYEAARAALDEALAASPEAPLWLLAFHVRALLEDFDGATAAMRRLVEFEADLAAPMEALRLCVESDRICAARRVDPVMAGKRAAVRPPPAFCLFYAKAAVMRAQGEHAEVKRALEEGRAEVPAVSGKLTTTSGEVYQFIDIADKDDITGPLLPCFDDGSVLDVPYCDLLSVELLAPSIALDRVWMPAKLVLRDGGELLARIPALYSGAGRHPDARVRTGEAALWETSRGYEEGSGQRHVRLSLEGGGSAAIGLRAIERIDFDAPGGVEEGQKLFLSRMGWGIRPS